MVTHKHIFLSHFITGNFCVNWRCVCKQGEGRIGESWRFFFMVNTKTSFRLCNLAHTGSHWKNCSTNILRYKNTDVVYLDIEKVCSSTFRLDIMNCLFNILNTLFPHSFTLYISWGSAYHSTPTCDDACDQQSSLCNLKEFCTDPKTIYWVIVWWKRLMWICFSPWLCINLFLSNKLTSWECF